MHARAFAVGFVFAAFVIAPARARAQDSDLQVQNVGPSEGDYDTDLEFDVTITNLGPDAADVTLSNPVPQGMRFFDAYSTSADVSCVEPESGATTGTVTCSVASLANQATVLIKLIFRIDDLAPSPTLLTSVATVSTSANDTNTANDVATATVPVPAGPPADISAHARVPYPSEILGGATRDAVFAFSAKNEGSSEAKHVLMTCSFPPGITFRIAPFPRNNGGPYCSASLAPDTITCGFSIAPGAALEIVFRSAIPAGTADGTIVEAAVKLTYPGDSNPDNDSATISKCIQADYCAAGPCNANVAVECPDTGDPCATCNPITGLCRSTGALCDDGDACTLGDRCYDGQCRYNSSVMCRSTTCMPKACDHATGECVQSGPTPDLPECAFPPKPPRDEDAGTAGELDASVGMPPGADAGKTAGGDAASVDGGEAGGDASHHGQGVKTRDAGERMFMDAGVGARMNDGCACRVHAGTRAPSRWPSFTLLGFGLLAARRLRRRHASRALSARSARRAMSPDDCCAAR